MISHEELLELGFLQKEKQPEVYYHPTKKIHVIRDFIQDVSHLKMLLHDSCCISEEKTTTENSCRNNNTPLLTPLEDTKDLVGVKFIHSEVELIQGYKTKDGKIFSDIDKANKHAGELRRNQSINKAFDNFLNQLE